MRRVICFLVLSVTVLTGQAADRGPLNNEMPSWITLGAQTRFRAEGSHGNGFVEGANDDFFLHRYRFSVGLRPLKWLQVFGEAQDARAAFLPNANGSVKDRLDLRQAWVGVGDEGGLWDLKVGRQRLSFGSERVIGAAEWGNTARVFDAVRLGLHRGKDRLDLFASSLVNNDADQQNHHQQGNNLHGAYASLGSLLPGSKVEPFVLLRTSPLVRSEAGVAGKYLSWTWGLRSAGAVRKSWSYEGEILLQRGNVSSSRLSAWAATIQVQRLFTRLRWQPSLLAEYNYASGDNGRGDNVVNTFDQLYPTNHYFYGIADQVARRNMKNVRGGVWVHPRKWLTLKAEGHSFWLANRNDAFYLFNGNVSVPAVAGGARVTHAGQELDVIGEVKLSNFYDIGAQCGHLFPGSFLRRYTSGAGRTFYAAFISFRL